MNFKLSVVFVLITSSLYSQTIERLQNKLLLMNSSPSKEIKNEAARISGLVNDVQPTLYLQQGTQLKYSESVAPVLIISDIRSLPLLYRYNKLFKSVELICVKVESPTEMHEALDISNIKGFENLKYIYILFTSNPCGEGVVANSCYYNTVADMLRNVENFNCKIVYEVSVNE